MLAQLLQAFLILLGLSGQPEPIHLPGPEYHWTGLGAWAAANMKADLGFDCGKLVWLPDRTKPTLTPLKILWEASDPDEPIPQHILDSYPQVIVSVALTKECPIRGPPAALVASPAILLKSSTSPWTVDATYNTASNTIYAVGPGGNGADGTTSTNSGGGGGGGATVFVANYNNSWTPGTSTATFQVTGGNSGAEGAAGANTTFDSSAFVARAGGAASGATLGTGALATSSVVPAGGTKHKGGDGGGGRVQASQSRGGAGGGAAAGTTGDGAVGGDMTGNAHQGGAGGGGADGGSPGNVPTTSDGAAGGASGIVGSTGGAGATATSAAGIGSLGGGGGGGHQTSNPTGATPALAGTQEFDSTHGTGGGGGGSGAANNAQAGGGGQFGGGAGGGCVNGGSGRGLGGTGGDGIVFITWTPAASGVIYSPMTPMTGGGRITVLELIGKAVNDNLRAWLDAA